MNIQVSDGIGYGPTELSAFDQALINAGIANFNLIYLSSVLPPGSNVHIERSPKPPKGNWGDRLYVVMAQQRTSQANQGVWAGVGWIQDPETNKGLLVEHEGNSEEDVRSDIHNSLVALARNRKVKFSEPKMHVAGTTCTDQPVCVLVVAVFESASWQFLKEDDAVSSIEYSGAE